MILSLAMCRILSGNIFGLNQRRLNKGGNSYGSNKIDNRKF